MLCAMIHNLSILLVPILGIIGNAITFCTFGKMRNQNSSTALLRFLAVIDSALLLLIWLQAAVILFLQYTWWPFVSAHYILLTLYSMARTATIWTAVLVGLHRYIAVCKQFSASRMCIMRYARIQFLCVLVSSVIVNLPYLFVYKRQELTANRTDTNSSYEAHVEQYNKIAMVQDRI